MEPSITRASSIRQTPLHPEEASRSSNEITPAEARAMLSELSGTPLPAGEAWDAEARARLASFQRSEGLAPTGELDDVTVGRRKTRFEQVVAARPPTATGELRNESPTAAEHHQVVAVVQGALRATEDVASQLGADSSLRARYIEEAREYSSNIVKAYERGEISAGEAAYLASSMRNGVMNEARGGLSPAGAALSKLIKAEGVSLPVLFEKYAAREFGGRAFKDLSAAERNSLCIKIAERAGVTNSNVNLASKLAPKLGKVMLGVTIAVALYQVATAEDKLGEGIKQGAAFLGFLAGAKVGGLAGAAVCGPPCAVIGGLAGGIVGSLLAEEAADYGYHRIRG